MRTHAPHPTHNPNSFKTYRALCSQNNGTHSGMVDDRFGAVPTCKRCLTMLANEDEAKAST